MMQGQQNVKFCRLQSRCRMHHRVRESSTFIKTIHWNTVE